MERDNVIFLAKIAERTERYNDMIEYVRLFAKLGQELTFEERVLFSIAYKNVIATKRVAYRTLLHMLDEHEMMFRDQISMVKNAVEMEICNVCSDAINVIRSHILPHSSNAETTVFMLKMLGDYYRYLAEVTDKPTHGGEAQHAYSMAVNYATKHLSAVNPTRLGLMLNFSVFYYEIEKDLQSALSLAQTAYDTALVELDGDSDAREAVAILRLLRDNISLWKDMLVNPEMDNPLATCFQPSTPQANHRNAQSSLPAQYNSPLNPSPVGFSPSHLSRMDAHSSQTPQTTPQTTPTSRYFTPIDANVLASPRASNPNGRQVMMSSPRQAV